MRWAVHAEWTKLRTVPSTAWLLLAIVGLTVALSAAATASADTSHCPSPNECFEDITKLSLTGVWLGQAAVAVLAVLAMTNEYGTRLIQTTLAANPWRVQVLAAKAAVLTVTVFGAGVLGVVGSLVAGRVILPGNGFTPANGYPPLSVADEPTLRAAAGTVLYLGLVALLSLGAATVIRDGATAITTVLALLFVVPVISQFVTDPTWSTRLRRYSPTTAGLAVQATTGLDRLPIGPWAGLGVLAAYAGTAMLGASAILKIRDA
jgi:ABC-2 type transport system permease protein